MEYGHLLSSDGGPCPAGRYRSLQIYNVNQKKKIPGESVLVKDVGLTAL